jgi:hypothetical protein
MMAHASVKEQLPKHGVFMITVDTGCATNADPAEVARKTNKCTNSNLR